MGQSKEEVIEIVKATGLSEKLGLIYIETPANPTNDLIDIESSKEIATYFSTTDKDIYLAIDNSYMGPL